jgi:hypothetical protein
MRRMNPAQGIPVYSAGIGQGGTRVPGADGVPPMPAFARILGGGAGCHGTPHGKSLDKHKFMDPGLQGVSSPPTPGACRPAGGSQCD